MLYKRNQVEEAIATSFGAKRSDVSTRLKRLLDTDRTTGKPYAFFSTKPSGKGFEVEFAEYEVFALWAALQLLEHGFPQQSSVAILKRARTELEAEHARILQLPNDIFLDDEAMLKNARPGSLPINNRYPAFLVVERPPRDGTASSKDASAKGFSICRGVAEMMDAVKGSLGPKTILGTVTPAKVLHELLAKTTPEPRGRRPGT